MICKCEFCGEQFGSALDCRNHEKTVHCPNVRELSMHWNGEEWDFRETPHDWSMNDHLYVVHQTIVNDLRHAEGTFCILTQPDDASKKKALGILKKVVAEDLDSAKDQLSYVMLNCFSI